MPYVLAPHPSPRWREPQRCRTIHEDQPPYDIRMAGAVSPRRTGSAEGQTAFWKTAQTGCARHTMDLQHGNAEEPVAIEVRLRAVDARHGGKADQGKFGAVLSANSVGRLLAQLGITCQKPLHRAQERDEALVEQWLKKDFCNGPSVVNPSFALSDRRALASVRGRREAAT